MAIAKKTGCDVVPVFHNAGKIWAKGSFIKKSGVITMVIGKSIKSTGKNASTLTQEVRDWTLLMQQKY
jgi:1-acyl-sn-glycerol-3-phosphate acyltransferase